MGFKHQRLSDRLRTAPVRELYRGAHVFFGGTGAVGGTAVVKSLDLLEELMCIHPPRPDEVPVLVATGRTSKERGDFIERVERLLSARAGKPVKLGKTDHGRPFAGEKTDIFLTPSGVAIAVAPFAISPLPGLSRLARHKDAPAGEVRAILAEAGIGGGGEPVLDALARTVEAGRAFGAFLQEFRAVHDTLELPPLYSSVLVGIPIPSLIAYTEDWELARRHVEGVTDDVVERLKTRFKASIHRDLARVRAELAREVVIAHTTAVGGMYDDVPGEDGKLHPRIRLGFSHSAKDENLAEKQRSAEDLTAEYASLNLKVFITAAAIGIDDVPIREPVRLHSAVARQLRDIEAALPPLPDDKAGRKAYLARVRGPRAFGLPRANVQVHEPFDLPLDAPPDEPIVYFREPPAKQEQNRASLLRPTYAVRSGENGVFTVANSDALYRVMRVASASELGQVLATVMLLGDDPHHRFFVDDPRASKGPPSGGEGAPADGGAPRRGGVCYYAETDNSRQVFDFLAHPTLRHMQLSGLEPMALQDLGSAKHQCELHLLGLLILLHRLRTLDLEAIPPYVDGDRFDARGFFEQASEALTFEEIATWDAATLAADLRTLATAERPEDLHPLLHSLRGSDELLYREVRTARRRVLEEVLQAVRAIPSLGTPIVYERDGRARVRTGFYVAPLEKVLRSTGEIAAHFRGGSSAAAAGNGKAAPPADAFEDVRDYHLCVGGFIDLRPHAIVCTSRYDRDLAGKIVRVSTADELRAALARVAREEPYGFFTTCGVVALLFRLQALGRILAEAMIELGTLQEFRWQMPRDARGHILMLPGAVEAFRMVSEGYEKTTGTERLDGLWGYERRSPPARTVRPRARTREAKGEAVPA